MLAVAGRRYSDETLSQRGRDMTTYASKTEELTAFLNRYIHCIDDDRLEGWPEFFEDICIYKIIPRENTERNLPIALVYCDNKGMLIDRVVSLRKANVYNLHYDRHIVSNVLVSDGEGESWNLKANYIVYQTDLEGESMLFSTGKYDAVVVRNGDGHRFKEMIVTVDTYAVPNLISTPL